MEKIILKGHKGIGGLAEGEALVTRDPISYFSDVGGALAEPMSAVVTNKLSLPELYGENLANKVLVFPTGKAGIVSTALIMGLVKHGLGPKAMINIKTHPLFALTAIVTDIPTVDGLNENPCEVIETGDYVKVDGRTGTVEVTKKKG
jgi:predicted aconitase with swiveling domain